FFQAEDGIRDATVTGVQTCALPISVESVAENLTDAAVAPACFYLVFGLAGAAVYRAVNTADAMFGYREGPLEHFGKVAARLDDRSEERRVGKECRGQWQRRVGEPKT